MKPKVLIFASKDKPNAKKSRDQLVEFLKKQKIGFVDVTGTEGKITAKKLDGVQIGVVIGGDGTFLTLVRRLPQKDQFALMGINLGTLGFITEIGSQQMCQAVMDALKGKFIEEERPLLEVEIWRGGKKVESETVFNDAVITKDARTSMLKFSLSFEGQHLSDVRADGVIVATSTGSTAYALSAGGPLVHPQVNAIILVPICSHSLTNRPMLLPLHAVIEIAAQEFNGSVYLVYDGQVSFELRSSDKVRIKQSKHSLRLIHSPRNQWPRTIRAELGME